MTNRLPHIAAAALFAISIGAFANVASAMPIADALAIKNSTATNIETVYWRGRGWRRGGWGWGVGAGLVGGAIISGALTSPYYYDYPAYDYPAYDYPAEYGYPTYYGPSIYYYPRPIYSTPAYRTRGCFYNDLQREVCR